jgi:SAM-dependent methyltransferase
VLDVGCGVGALTESLGGLGYEALGIDPSEQSIKLAKRYNPAGNYQAASLEKFALKSPTPFHAVVANMVLHSVPDLGGFLAAARSILDENGIFIATIPHPRYYLQQRPDVMFSESDYDDCRLYWLNFRIHGKRPHPTKVPYFHRPTEDYVTLLTRNRFAISEFEAPPQVGIGKPHDILLIVADRLPQPLSRAA